jgi:hypothetical protein
MVKRRLFALSLSLTAALACPLGVWAAEAQGQGQGKGKEVQTPNIVVGPSEVEAAPHVDARIEEVTVFSDRARVRRRGRASLEPGATLVRLPDLPGATFLDTIHVSATGARVLRVETTPIEHERMEIGQVVKLLDALDAAGDRAAELADRAALDRLEIDLLTRLAPEPQVSEEKREGRKGVALDVGSWWKALDFLAARTRAAQTRLAAFEADRQKLETERQRLQAEIGQLDQGGFSERAVEVVAVLEGGAAAAAEVQLEYFVPAARWKPSYDLHFSTARGQVRLETAAVVEQATGEDWPETAVSFSTATPGRGIELPELLTWTLGERSEFVPQPRARVSPPAEPFYPVPAPEPIAASARAIDDELVRRRLELAKNATSPSSVATGELAQAEIRRQVAEDMELAGLSGEGSLGKDRSRVGRSDSLDDLDGLIDGAVAKTAGKRLRPRAAVRRAQSVAGADEAEERPVSTESQASYRDVVSVPHKRALKLGKGGPVTRQNYEAYSGQVSSAPAPAAAPPPAPVTRVPLALYDRPPPSETPQLSDPYLPAVSAGGFDFVYRAPTPVAVPSTGKELRIPLASQTFRTTAYYEATPALATTAFLRARVRNDGKRPLLRGPAAIFGDGELVGVGEIQTTGPSGDIELPLGADQDIRLVRQVVPSTKTTGLVFKIDETTYDVQIQIGNFKKQPVSIEVTDQVPRSRNEKVVVKLLATDPKPLGEVDLDGTIRFRVDVPASETRTVKFRYQITRPQNWELYQR